MQQPKRYAFIFDMDGTLVDNMRVHNQIWIDFLTELGGSPDPLTFNELTAGKTNPEIMRMFLKDGLTAEQMHAYAEEKEKRYREQYRNQVQAIPGAYSFLKAAQEMGIALGLSTSAGRPNVSMVMDGCDLAQFFSTMVTVEDIQRGKPDPEIFLKAAERLEVKPEQCLVFEDSRGGIEAAYRAGMPVVALTTGLAREQVLALPGVKMAVADYTGLNPGELLAGLLNHR